MSDQTPRTQAEADALLRRTLDHLHFKDEKALEPDIVAYLSRPASDVPSDGPAAYLTRTHDQGAEHPVLPILREVRDALAYRAQTKEESDALCDKVMRAIRLLHPAALSAQPPAPSWPTDNDGKPYPPEYRTDWTPTHGGFKAAYTSGAPEGVYFVSDVEMAQIANTQARRLAQPPAPSGEAWDMYCPSCGGGMDYGRIVEKLHCYVCVAPWPEELVAKARAALAPSETQQ